MSNTYYCYVLNVELDLMCAHYNPLHMLYIHTSVYSSAVAKTFLKSFSKGQKYLNLM